MSLQTPVIISLFHLSMAIRDDLSGDVRREYLRCLEEVGEEDPYAGRDTLGIRDVLRAHFLIADFFYREGEGIGGIGPRDLHLLHSAMSRQFVSLGGRLKWSTKYEICATLLFGLVKDHPFHDANKRTAFLSTVHYLYVHGRTPSLSHKELEDFIVDIADNRLGKYKRYAALRKAKKVDDPEVKFIADFLRRYTRTIDKREYIVTFRELRKILNRFECDISDPVKNFSEVTKRVRKRKLISRKEYWETKRVMQVSCPGMTREVPHSTVREIRKQAGLTFKDGIDSSEFYSGADSMGGLISYYRAPLLSLANR